MEKGRGSQTMQAVNIEQQPAVLVSAFTVVVGTEAINQQNQRTFEVCGSSPRQSGEVGTTHCRDEELSRTEAGCVGCGIEDGGKSVKSCLWKPRSEPDSSKGQRRESNNSIWSAQPKSRGWRRVRRSWQKLRVQQVAQPGPLPPPVDANAEVSRLQQMVLDLQRQLQGPVAPLVVSPLRLFIFYGVRRNQSSQTN